METLGFNSPSLNPENCRLNGDRKLHYVRKIKHVHIVTAWVRMDFLHEVQFSAAIEAAHFPAETTRPLGPRLSAIFTLLWVVLLRYSCENGRRRRAQCPVSTAGKCAASMAAENCWRKKYLFVHIDIMTTHWTQLFSARSAIFCRYWTCSFSGRNNQAIEAEVVCIFTFFYIP